MPAEAPHESQEGDSTSDPNGHMDSRGSDHTTHIKDAGRVSVGRLPFPRPSPPAADFGQTPHVSPQKSYLAPQVFPSSPPVSEVVEAAGAGLRVKPPQVDDAGDIRWVMENMHSEDAEVRAPSRSALAMLMFARLDNNTRVVFVRDIFGKVFVNKNAEEQERRERKRLGEIGEMVERCLGMRLRVEGELCEPEWVEEVVNG